MTLDVGCCERSRDGHWTLRHLNDSESRDGAGFGVLKIKGYLCVWVHPYPLKKKWSSPYGNSYVSPDPFHVASFYRVRARASSWESKAIFSKQRRIGQKFPNSNAQWNWSVNLLKTLLLQLHSQTLWFNKFRVLVWKPVILATVPVRATLVLLCEKWG